MCILADCCRALSYKFNSQWLCVIFSNISSLKLFFSNTEYDCQVFSTCAFEVRNGDEITKTDKVVAIVRHSLCSLCERCIDACPYGARTLDMDSEKVEVNPVMCQGCGSCASVCPNSASVVEGFEMPQMFGVIDAAMVNGRISEKGANYGILHFPLNTLKEC